MSSKKVLGPPKGAAETAEVARQAVLRGRFSDTQADTANTTSDTTSQADTLTSHTPHTQVQRRSGKSERRPEPPGMTRRTYYLPETAADALDDAVTKIQAATGGHTSKHEALAALIAAGVDQADALAAELRAALLRDLQR